MKKTLFLLLSVLILSSCDNNSSKETKVENKIEASENFDWLIGKWKRNNSELPRTTYEVWHKISRDEYKGWGYTMEYHDTISMENLSLTKINNKWRVSVVTQEGGTPTYFHMTKIDSNSFVCENHEIDFSFTRIKGKDKIIESNHENHEGHNHEGHNHN